MKKYTSSHFVYTKHQRNGIFLLVILIIIVQGLLFFVDFHPKKPVNFDSQEIAVFQAQIDNLKQIALEKRKPKIYPFNPNFISDYKGYQLGMTTQEIDRLHQFRSQGKFVNSASEFQQVTQISDSLLETMSPNFKFPDWVNQKNKKLTKKAFNPVDNNGVFKISTTDMNNATFDDFLTIQGVDQHLSERIIKYRTKLQGFSTEDQIFEVWGMDQEIGARILEHFTVETQPQIQKININTASFKEVLKIPYIDYDLCLKIFDYRDEVAELQAISELKNIPGFPLDKYDRIVVYLFAE
jgi:DNA uptake protein ComE-like DNA-binding protein